MNTTTVSSSNVVKEAPGEIEIRQQVALIILNIAKQYGVSVIIYKQGGNAEEELELALSDVAAGEFERARAILERAHARALLSNASVDPSAAKAAYGLARLAEREANFKLAQERMAEAIRWDSSNRLYQLYATRLSAFLMGPDTDLRPERQSEMSQVVASTTAERSIMHRWLGDAYQDV